MVSERYITSERYGCVRLNGGTLHKTEMNGNVFEWSPSAANNDSNFAIMTKYASARLHSIILNYQN